MDNIIYISIIVPFYHGNGYMLRLLDSIKRCAEYCKDKSRFEVIVVNDSPEEKVCIPQKFEKMNISVISNEWNMGIQRTRINGLKYAKGDWILFLDQDDELICDGFLNQISLTKTNDVIIGNGLYQIDQCNIPIFHSYREMCYFMHLSRFIQIRNLIPSPGECLLRKDIIPQKWIENPLDNNGADDWLLWILLLKNEARVGCNPNLVYIHNNTHGKNLSSDLNKMKESSCEMYKLLTNLKCLNEDEKIDLKNAIMFKYLQDTKKLRLKDLWKYRSTILANVCYKAHVIAYRTLKEQVQMNRVKNHKKL